MRTYPPEHIEKPDGSVERVEHFDTGEKTYNREETQKAAKATIAGLFGTSDTGLQCSIERIRPIWCAGWLDTIPVETDETGAPIFSVEEIRETYGGEKFFIRFLDHRGKYVACKTLNIRGVAPRMDGKTLQTPLEKENEERAAKQAEIAASKRDRESDGIMKILLEQTRASQETSMMFLREQLQKKDDPLSSVAPILSMFQALERFKGGQTDSMGGLLGGLMEAFKNIPPPPTQNRSALPAIVPAAVPVSVPGPVPVPVPGPVPVESSKNRVSDCQEPKEEYDLSISEELAGLNDEDLSAAITDTIARIGEARAVALFQRLAGAANNDPANQNDAGKSNG